MKIRPVTISNISEIPDDIFEGISCKYCVYWERPEFFPKVRGEEAWLLKREWYMTSCKGLPFCGALAFIDGKSVGYIQFSLPEHLPCTKEYHVLPDPHAVFIACIAVAPKYRGRGIGSALLAFVEKAVSARSEALETFASRKEDAPSGPIEFFLRHGFRVKVDHPEYPLLRKALTL